MTVLKEYVFDAFEVEAYDYLVKPLDDSHFRRTMDRALRVLEQRAEKNIVVHRGHPVRLFLWRRSYTVKCRGGKFIFTKVTEKSLIIMKSWKILSGLWINAFSGAIEVIWSIWDISAGVKAGGLDCPKVMKFLFPDCGNGT